MLQPLWNAGSSWGSVWWGCTQLCWPGNKTPKWFIRKAEAAAKFKRGTNTHTPNHATWSHFLMLNCSADVANDLDLFCKQNVCSSGHSTVKHEEYRWSQREFKQSEAVPLELNHNYFFFFYIKTTKTNFTKLLCLKPTQNKTYLSLRKNIFCDLKYE